MKFKNWLNENQTEEQNSFKIYETSDLIEISYTGGDIKGYLHAQRDADNPDIFRVIRVSVNPTGKGYGKKLYLKAIELATKKNVLLAPAKNSTSDSALNVWKSIYLSGIVERIPLKPSDWPVGSRNTNLLKNYPNLRYSDPKTHPSKNDLNFWIINSGYKLK